MSNQLIVQKFGGSSLADVERLQQVADKIVATKRSGVDLVVVVSAMGDTTNELLEMAGKVSDNPSRRELDMLLSVGERISMALLSMAIERAGLSAISLTGSQCGIITTDSHTNARVIDVRPFRVHDELETGHIVIVAGYQGTSYRREVTTLGRGGSDTTAVALAAALGATACEIYSDVDGIFSADPRVVVDAEKLETLSYEEMQELARSGAKVLNEQAVEFARRKQIALYARSTHDADSKGTVIRPDGADTKQPVSVAAVSHVREGRWFVGETPPEILQKTACAFVAWPNQTSCCAFALLDDIHDLDTFEARCGEHGAVEARGLVSIVGIGIGRTFDFALRGSKCLGDYDHRFISSNRVSWVVATDAVDDASNALHTCFIATNR